MPPTMGDAMRRMTSEPVPAPNKIGKSPATMTATVMAFGRTRRTAPSSMASIRSRSILKLPACRDVRRKRGCIGRPPKSKETTSWRQRARIPRIPADRRLHVRNRCCLEESGEGRRRVSLGPPRRSRLCRPHQLPPRQDRLRRVFTEACRTGKKQYNKDCIRASVAPDKDFLTDLGLHDLRHEATTCFFERGLNLIEVASITGHRSRNPKHLRPRNQQRRHKHPGAHTTHAVHIRERIVQTCHGQQDH